MAENKRTEFEAERDREIIARLYLRGDSQQAITDHLNETYYSLNPISRQQISYDVRLIIGRWMKSATNHIDQRKAIELARIDHLETVYWDAWERSKENAEVEVTEQIGTRKKAKAGEAVDLSITPERIKKYRKEEGQSGNPSFLAGIQWCIEKRCQILGLDAPKRSEITGKDGEPLCVVVRVTDDETGDV